MGFRPGGHEEQVRQEYSQTETTLPHWQPHVHGVQRTPRAQQMANGTGKVGRTVREKEISHMRFAINFYRLQAKAGRFFLHEHPNSASSWKLPEVMTFMSDLGITKSVAHLCRYGMTSEDGEGVECIKTPTGFVTNSSEEPTPEDLYGRTQACAARRRESQSLPDVPSEVMQGHAQGHSQ